LAMADDVNPCAERRVYPQGRGEFWGCIHRS